MKTLTKSILLSWSLLAFGLIACDNPVETIKNSDNAILKFSIGENSGAITGNEIVLFLPTDTDTTSLAPSIVLSAGAAVSPASGEARDFSGGPVVYRVSAEDGSVREYRAIVDKNSRHPPAFYSVGAMSAWLAAFTGQNNPENPVRVALVLEDPEDLVAPFHNTASRMSDPMGAFFDNLHGKYVSLDLSNCGWTEFFSLSGTDDNNKYRIDGDKLVEVILPGGLETLGARMFCGLKNLKKVTLSPAIATIGERAFKNCTSLTEVDFAGASFPVSIGDSAFSGCTGLADISAILARVDSIGDYMFEDCTGLTEVTIPAGVTSIGNFVFSGCTGLTDITAALANITSIGNYMFYECTGLSRVTIPAGVTSIGDRVFSGCTSLAEVTLPATLTSIDFMAFSGCTSLTSLTLLRPSSSGITTLEVWALNNTPLATTDGGSIYVPDAASVTAYKAAENWSDAGIADNIKVKS